MTTLAQVTYNVLNTLRGGHAQNAETYSVRQIAYVVNYYRALLIRRDFERSFRPDGLEQDLGLLNVEIVDPSAGVMRISAGRGLLVRTTAKIPTPVRLKDRIGITAVTSPDFRYEFPIIDPHRTRWIAYEKFTSQKGRAFLFDEKIHVHTSLLAAEITQVLLGLKNASAIPAETFVSHSPYVRVRGIFEDPRAAYELATGKEWDDNTSPYPLPGDMEQRIISGLLSGEFDIMKKSVNDQTSDMMSEADAK